MECILCKNKGEHSVALCQTCQQTLPWHTSKNVAFRYQPPIDDWITQLKFHRRLAYAKLLGSLMAKKVSSQAKHFDYIIPIPLHTRRLCYRGFNQATEIARPLSRLLHKTLHVKILTRTRSTQSQSKLNKKERAKNLNQAFQCRKKLAGTRIALFDDVITTGNTTKSAYITLKQAGILNIRILACAKTPEK